MSTMMGASSKCAMTTIIVMMYVNVPSARRYEGERERERKHTRNEERKTLTKVSEGEREDKLKKN